MYVINRQALTNALRAKGYKTINEFCKSVGIHRNSLSRYLCGAPVLPKVVERVFVALNSSPLDFLEEKISSVTAKMDKDLAILVERLVKKTPSIGLVLFGSRAAGSNKPYSDLDLGIIGKDKLGISELADMLEIVDQETKNWPYRVDLVDLGRASPSFLAEIKKTAKFLGGNPRYL